MICPYLNKECNYDCMADICQNCIHIISRENDENKKTNSRTDKK